ncbi:hypothetical protein DBV05_g12156 [Lasiodiplodia theobromae]|uniref:NmrA-like domain-containing protein n=1 Tax=Lasiodiplodia theobromae TaxID=45133 RepID=A0A5N5CUY9_9PEZI|nr:hypothetical protein DBV05_g12156 [Lasiodiplodia theobromae]
MVKVAIAGGTSPTLGQAIISAMLKTHPENTPIIILSSRPPPSTPTHATAADPSTISAASDPTTINTTSTLHAGRVEVRHVAYDSHTSLTAALHDVHTVVSVIKIPDPDAMRDAQLALLRAAKAAGCRRFAPSEWAFGAAGRVDAVRGKDEVWDACRASGLECARFRCGAFMNYLGVGRAFSSEDAREKALAGLRGDGPVWWDFEGGVAELPVVVEAEGEEGGGKRRFPRVTLTEIDDVGRFVAAACALTEGSWLEEMDMVGETVRVDEVVGLVKECLGIELKVVGVTREELERRVSEVEGVGKTREEVLKKMIAQLSLVMLEEKEGWAIMKPTLNELCWHTKPLSVREYLTNYQ